MDLGFVDTMQVKANSLLLALTMSALLCLICLNQTDPSLLRKAAAAPTDSSTVRVSVNDTNMRMAINHTNGEHNEEDHSKGGRSAKQPLVKRPDKQHRVSSDLVSSDANGHRRPLLSLASKRSRRVSSAARLRARSDANATNVFVFGLESSGTRFLSRAIASAIKPTKWDGERPPCWLSLIHISEPTRPY